MNARVYMPGDADWCEAHGIDPEVFAARGVWRYGTTDIDRVKDDFRSHLESAKLSTVTKIVHQSSGLLLPKSPIPGGSPVIPQLRPDKPVLVDSQKRWHFHGQLADELPVFPPEAGAKRVGKRLPSLLILQGEDALAHINRSRGERYDSQTGLGSHYGENRDDVHFHLDLAKYVLLGKGLCQRIDLHPWASLRVANAPRIFFVLEGALKNDAIISAGEAVFSVPSVTMWDPCELKRWIAHIRRINPEATIFVVPDADWISNPQVELQAYYVRSCVRRSGLRAHIAAPPVQHGQEKCECSPGGRTSNGRTCDACGGFLKGVDDFLGAGGTIDGLIVSGREAPHDSIDSWKPDATENLARVQRARRALTELSQHANDDGSLYTPISTLARIEAIRKRAVVETLDDLAGAIEVEGSLATDVKDWWYIDEATGEVHVARVLDWIERPTIVVRRDFRAVKNPDVTVGEFCGKVIDLASHRADSDDFLGRELRKAA